MPEPNPPISEENTLLAKKLHELASLNPSGKVLGDEVAGSSEETAELFSSRYRPALLRDTDLGGDQPDGVNIRFGTR